jgi:hypothetical protein
MIPYGQDQNLDDLYDQLGVIEQREIDAIHYGRLDLLPSIRAEQLPLKRRINDAEGCLIYEEAGMSPARPEWNEGGHLRIQQAHTPP